MQFWHRRSCSCLSLLCSEAQLRFSEESLLSRPSELTSKVRQKWTRAGGTEGRTKENGGISFLHCIQTAVTERLDLWRQTHQLKQLHLHQRLCTAAYLYFFLFVLHLLPADYCAEGFSFVLGKRALFPPGLIPSRRPESPYKQLSVCRLAKFWTDHQCSQTTSEKNFFFFFFNFNLVMYIQNRHKCIHTQRASCKIHPSSGLEPFHRHIAAENI